MVEIRLRLSPEAHEALKIKSQVSLRSLQGEAQYALEEYALNGKAVYRLRPSKANFKTPSISTDGIVTED